MIPTIASQRPRLNIVVLAAGFSRRLGTPKALARIHGMNLLERTLRVLAPFATSTRILVIVPPKSGRYRFLHNVKSADFVVNARCEAGLSSSIRLGVANARTAAAVLLVPVDLARLQRHEIARLISHWRGARRHVVARSIDGQAGTPVILPRWLFGLALELTGDRGLRDLLHRLPDGVVLPVDMPSAAIDIDTPQDLEDARRRLRPRPT